MSDLYVPNTRVPSLCVPPVQVQVQSVLQVQVRARVWWPLPPLHSDTRHQPPAPFSCSDLARRFAPPTVKPSISFFPCSIPPHPPLSSAQIITSPLPHLRPPTSPSAFDFDLSSPAESSHVHLRPTSTTAKLTFVSSKSGIPVLASNPSSSSSFFVLRLVQSFSSQERVNEATAVGRKQPKANCTPPPQVESSAAQPSPALGRPVVRCPLPSAHFN